MSIAQHSTAVHPFSTSLGTVRARIVGSGPIAVLWHGMFVDGRTWDGVVARLRERRTLVVLDGPGYGSSDRLERLTSIEECAEVAAEIIAQLPGDDRVDWVGAAWGGHVGMTVASLYPHLLRSLVAVSSPVEPIDPVFRIKLIVANGMLARLGPIAHLRHAVHESQVTDDHRRIASMTDVIDSTMAATERKALARTVTSFIINRADASHRLGRIQAPTLLVTGDDRAEWSPRTMADAARRIPDARTAVIAGARTLVPVEQPDRLAQVVGSFWDELDAR